MTTDVSIEQAGSSRPWLCALVFGLDARLRESLGIREYSSDPDCLFRIQHSTADTDFCFADGVWLRVGDPVLALHFWNEHFPTIPTSGPSFGWALRLERSFTLSLRELAIYVRQHNEFSDIKALRGDYGLSIRTKQMLRVTGRFGFEETRRDDILSMRERLHRRGENVLALLLALAANPVTARLGILQLGRAHVCMSRTTLERRYGRGCGT